MWGVVPVDDDGSDWGVSDRDELCGAAGENWNGFDRPDRFVELLESPENVCCGDRVWPVKDGPAAAENGRPGWWAAGEAEVRSEVAEVEFAEVGDCESGGRRRLGGGTMSCEREGRALWLDDELSLARFDADEGVEGCVTVLGTCECSSKACRCQRGSQDIG